MKEHEDAPVLIAGGGPVGLTLALNLAIEKVPFVLLEANHSIPNDPRAGTVLPSSLELFDTIGTAKLFIERGYAAHRYQYRDRKCGIIADFDLKTLTGATRFPFRLMLEQHKICAIVLQLLQKFCNHEILFGHKVKGVTQDLDGVTCEVETDSGRKHFRGSYMVGCDGAHSQVRKAMGARFRGFTYPERFLMICTRHDFTKDGFAFTNYVADPEEWCAIFKVPGEDEQGLWRIVFPTKLEERDEFLLQPDLLETRLQAFLPRHTPYTIEQARLYKVHQRVSDSFSHGRLLLAGDAAHINNPLGGMGMNSGFHDAFSLCKRLTQVIKKGAPSSILAQYDEERRIRAQTELQRQTIDNKKNIALSDPTEREQFHRRLRVICRNPRRTREYLQKMMMLNPD